jgi:hypothetical protein
MDVCGLTMGEISRYNAEIVQEAYVCTAVTCACASVLFSSSAICCRCTDGATISWPRMISRISLEVKDAILTLLRLPKSYMSSEYYARGV